MTQYAELVCRSNYSFLSGASHPEELVNRAADEGVNALALTDGDGLYGCVKAHLAAKARGLQFILGTTLTLTDGPSLCVYAADAIGYAHLCELISLSRLGHSKGRAGLSWQRVAERSKGLVALLPRNGAHGQATGGKLFELAEAFRGRFYVGVSRHLMPDDERRVGEAIALANALEVPLVAHNDVHTHHRERQPLQDVMTAIRHATTVAKAGTLLFANAERTVKGPEEMARLFADLPEAVGRTMEIAAACQFTFEQVVSDFSEEHLPKGMNRSQYLRHLIDVGLRERFPEGVSAAHRDQVAKELTLVEYLDYAGYFIAMWDIVRYARSRGILCQGRGSAANSIICYALFITSIDPVRSGLLFERFLSIERREPPDIDVDFEHERREEVIQYVYEKHGRHRAAMVSEHICYRGKLAVREVGKALGLSLDQVDRLAKSLDFGGEVGVYQLHAAGLSLGDRAVQLTLSLTKQLVGMPRHLSIHVGGFVITHKPLVSIAPVENGAMAARTVVQWDKDDLSNIGLLKVDLLGLGMLTVISRTFALIEETTGTKYDMATVPAEDPRVYDMLCEGDSIGTFQVESRAQQNMLPRLKPRCFYDLVIQIAIIRPGPIVGNMVHPFLRRRDGLEKVTYPSNDVRGILSRTLGVPIFQEQAMKLAIVAAGFSASEADRLRRAMTNKRASELLVPFRDKFIEGCLSRGYEPSFAERCFDSFKGFSEYGFPESHSASFALIAYVSSWLKRYYPAAFCAALLDAQPMGFYAPHTLVDDAKRHGVEVRPVDVNLSTWHCRLEPTLAPHAPAPHRVHAPVPEPVNEPDPEPAPVTASVPAPSTTPPTPPALRLGFELIKGVREPSLKQLCAVREAGGPFASIADLARRTRLPRHELTCLALAGALNSLSDNRRNALWDLAALGPFDADDLFFGMPMATDRPAFQQMTASERVSADFDTMGLCLEMHPVGLLRPHLKKLGALTAHELQTARAGQHVRVGGLVIVRQRPPTAKGFCFLSVEDETGIANFVVEPRNFERLRQVVTATSLVVGEGRIERTGRVVNLKIEHLEALEA